MAQHAPECAACQHHAPCLASPPPCSGSPPLLLAWTQALYGPFLALLRRSRRREAAPRPRQRPAPHVSLIVAAYREEAVIGAKVANALALDWPRDRLELIVAVDGGAEPDADATAERARAAGADQVLELPRGGKVRAQDAAVRAAPRRAARLLGRQRDLGAGRAARARRARSPIPRSPTRAARSASSPTRGTNQEGVYWRYEMWLRAQRVGAGVGDGGQRRDLRGPPRRLRRGRPRDGPRPLVPVPDGQARPPRGLRRPGARATEKMVPTIEGEWRAQAADDEPRLADRPARRPALPARLRPALRR